MQYRAVTADELSEKTKTIFEQYGVIRASVFGSCARGEMKRGSDIDIIVEFNEVKGLFVLVELKNRLEHKIGRKVDLVTEQGLKRSSIKDEVTAEAKTIYEQAS